MHLQLNVLSDVTLFYCYLDTGSELERPTLIRFNVKKINIISFLNSFIYLFTTPLPFKTGVVMYNCCKCLYDHCFHFRTTYAYYRLPQKYLPLIHWCWKGVIKFHSENNAISEFHFD